MADVEGFKYSKAYSLLQIMIAMSLSALACVALLQAYANFSREYKIQVAERSLLADAHIIESSLRAVLSHAGFSGCRRASEALVGNHTFPAIADWEVPASVQGFESAGAPPWLSRPVAAGTQGLLVNYLDNANTISLAADMLSQNQMVITHQEQLLPGDILGINDCYHIDLFTVADIHHQRASAYDEVISSQLLPMVYMRGSNIRHYRQRVFYIADTGRVDRTGQHIQALYTNSGELVAGITNWQLLFGIDPGDTGHTTQFLPLSAVTDWSQVRVIDVEFILVSAAARQPQLQQYWYNDKRQLAPDHRIYQSFHLRIGVGGHYEA